MYYTKQKITTPATLKGIEMIRGWFNKSEQRTFERLFKRHSFDLSVKGEQYHQESKYLYKAGMYYDCDSGAMWLNCEKHKACKPYMILTDTGCIKPVITEYNNKPYALISIDTYWYDPSNNNWFWEG